MRSRDVLRHRRLDDSACGMRLAEPPAICRRRKAAQPQDSLSRAAAGRTTSVARTIAYATILQRSASQFVLTCCVQSGRLQFARQARATPRMRWSASRGSGWARFASRAFDCATRFRGGMPLRRMLARCCSTAARSSSSSVPMTNHGSNSSRFSVRGAQIHDARGHKRSSVCRRQQRLRGADERGTCGSSRFRSGSPLFRRFRDSQRALEIGQFNHGAVIGRERLQRPALAEHASQLQ